MLSPAMNSRALPLLFALALLPARSHAEVVKHKDAPRIARDTRLGGTVVVEALVDTAGAVLATSIARSQPALDDEAAARVRRMRFAPLYSGSAAVPSLQRMPVEFEAPPGSGPAETWSAARCADATFALDFDIRPDSAGTFRARWKARGLKSQELFVVVLYPDGAEVDTAQAWSPQRLSDRSEAPAWPTWHRDGRAVRKGTEGEFAFRLPETPWWSAGRIAVVALFRDVFDGRTVVRQRAFRIDRDAMGALLVFDPAAPPCAAGPWHEGR